MYFIETVITRSILIAITMKGESVPSKCLIRQIVFCLFLLLEMSQGGKEVRKEEGVKIP